MKSDLHCLSIQQPFAWAVVAGVKDVENRSWVTDYRGPVVIQAGATKANTARVAKAGVLPAIDFAYSALIGVADLVDVVPLSEELESNPWAWGPQCWRFANARAFVQPIPSKGKLKLYPLDETTAMKVREAIATARPVTLGEMERTWIKSLTNFDLAEERDGRDTSLFENYAQLEDGVNALRIAKRRLARERTADTLVDVGRAHAVGESFSTALEALNDAIATDPNSARAFFMRGIVYGILSDLDNEKAVELDPALAQPAPTNGEEAEG